MQMSFLLSGNLICRHAVSHTCKSIMPLPKLRSPILLVHGLLGFDQIRLGGWTLADYFPGIPSALKLSGNEVFIPCLSPTKGIVDRATELKQFIDRISPTEPVHIIAHSMGGLDARYLVSKLDMGQRVLSLTTLGTPHRGSSFADWGIRNLEWMVRPFLEFVSMPYQAFYDLTTESCQRFNEDVPDVDGVRYFSVAGEMEWAWHRPEWLLSHTIVLATEGPNDGVVSVQSAAHGEVLEPWKGDHFSLINWAGVFTPGGLDANGEGKLFRTVLSRLAEDGF